MRGTYTERPYKIIHSFIHSADRNQALAWVKHRVRVSRNLWLKKPGSCITQNYGEQELRVSKEASLLRWKENGADKEHQSEPLQKGLPDGFYFSRALHAFSALGFRISPWYPFNKSLLCKPFVCGGERGALFLTSKCALTKTGAIVNF